MSVSSISFWQQDQNYWSQSSANGQSLAQTASVISNMFGASTTLSAGLASIANQTALDRVNSQLTSAVQSALAGIEGSSSGTSSSSTGSSSSSTSSSSSSSGSSGTSGSSSTPAAAPMPATGTGTAPLSAGTSLLTLGIVPTGAITVSDGTNTTTYKSTGRDTVGDLLNAFNNSAYGNAQVTAWLSSKGQLVIAAKNQTATISVGGVYAPNVGFGAGNNFFTATAPTTTSSSPSSSSTSSTSGTGSSASSSTGSATSSSSKPASSTSTSSSGASRLMNSALALQSSGTAEMLLAGSGLSGSLVNLLA